VLDAFVTELSGTDPVVEVPVAANHVPNVYVSVLAVRGRVAPPQPGGEAGGATQVTALVDLASRPSGWLRQARRRLGTAPLDVQVVPDREVYGVRERARVNVAVRRSLGAEPCRARRDRVRGGRRGVARAAAPTARGSCSRRLLQEAPPDRGDHRDRADAGVGKRTTGARRPRRWRRRPAGRAAAVRTPCCCGAPGALDAAGEAELEVPLNDSLSSFRLVRDRKRGSGPVRRGEARIRTHQDLMLLSGLLPVVREGDRTRDLHGAQRPPTGPFASTPAPR